MPFLMTYTPTVTGAIIDLQVRTPQPTIAPIFWGSALQLIYTDLVTAMTTQYTTAISGMVITFPPASMAPASIVPVPLNLATLTPLSTPAGATIDPQVKGVLGLATVTWTAFLTQLYTDFNTQFTTALATALTSLVVMAQPTPIPGVGLMAPAKITPMPWTPADFAPFSAKLLSSAPVSGALLDPAVKAAVLGAGPAGGMATWNLVVTQIGLDITMALATLAPLMPALFPTKLMLGPTSAPPAMAAPVPPAPPTPIPPTPALAV